MEDLRPIDDRPIRWILWNGYLLLIGKSRIPIGWGT